MRHKFLYIVVHTESARNISSFTNKYESGIELTIGIIIGIAAGIVGAACCICAALSICTTRLMITHNSKVTKRKRELTAQKKSPSPIYEEIDEIKHGPPVNVIELRQNEAYFKYSMT